MSGRSGNMPPRSRPAPDRPPVESCTIMPGQCCLEPFLQARKAFGVGGRFALVVAHVAMGDGGPGLECVMGAFDLFGDRDRHRRVVGLGRDRAGDGDADDAGVCHGQLHIQKDGFISPCRLMSNR